MTEFQDVEKQCKEEDCKQTFILEAGEQEFFHKKELHMPSRCKSCRDKKRRQKESPFAPLTGKEFPENQDGKEHIGVAEDGQEK